MNRVCREGVWRIWAYFFKGDAKTAVAGTQKDPPHLVEGQKTEETWADLLS